MTTSRRFSLARRRGVTVAECGVVYSITLLLTMMTMISGMGVFRYQQVASLARDGARWAAVRGPLYQQEQKQAAPTSQDLQSYIASRMVALDPTQLTCRLSMASNVATVTVTYNWIPEAYSGAITLTSTSVAPITY